jgi:hypothetical protein
VTLVEADTAEVVAVNVMLALPAGTVTVAGTTTEEELLLNDMEAPPVGAAEFKVTVPCELTPPVTEVGDRLMEAKEGGATVKLPVRVELT